MYTTFHKNYKNKKSRNPILRVRAHVRIRVKRMFPKVSDFGILRIHRIQRVGRVVCFHPTEVRECPRNDEME